MPEFTPGDHRAAAAMGITLLDNADYSHDAAVTRLYNTLATAYQRLDDECARVHRAERDARAEGERLRDCRNRLVWLLAIACGLVIGQMWVIFHG